MQRVCAARQRRAPNVLSNITATPSAVSGGAVSFDFTARAALEEVARGKHSRFTAGIDKTAQRLKGKAAKAQERQA